MSRPALTEEERQQILLFKKQNISNLALSKKMNRSPTVIQNFLNDPSTYATKPKGRKRSVDQCTERKILDLARNDATLTVRCLMRKIKDLNASETTVHRILFRNGLGRRRLKSKNTALTNPMPTRNADDLLVPQRSVIGWKLLVTSIHRNTQTHDIYEKFSQYGNITNIHLNLEHTGVRERYALVVYEIYMQACAAKVALNGIQILGKPIHVDWAGTEHF